MNTKFGDRRFHYTTNGSVSLSEFGGGEGGHMVSPEREPIRGGLGQSPQRSAAAEPVARGSRGKVCPPEAERLFAFALSEELASLS